MEGKKVWFVYIVAKVDPVVVDACKGLKAAEQLTSSVSSIAGNIFLWWLCHFLVDLLLYRGGGGSEPNSRWLAAAHFGRPTFFFWLAGHIVFYIIFIPPILGFIFFSRCDETPHRQQITGYHKLDARANVRANARVRIKVRIRVMVMVRVRVNVNAVICCRCGRCCRCSVSSHPFFFCIFWFRKIYWSLVCYDNVEHIRT